MRITSDGGIQTSGAELAVTQVKAAMTERAFISAVYTWMTIGLLLTGVVALGVASSDRMIGLLIEYPALIWVCIGFELLLVFVLSLAINKISSAFALALFLVYAAISGITFAIIFLAFTAESIALTFFITGGTFAVMSVYGWVTKADLTSLGNICMMLLFGVIIASIVNYFVGSSALYWIVTYVGIGVFVGLVAYDTQKIKQMAGGAEMGSEIAKKGAIMGALALYLDFINLFILLLRLFGDRK